MSRALICAGYAIGGILAIFALIVAVALFWAANYFVADFVLAVLRITLSQDNQWLLAVGLGLAEMGAFAGAMICRESF